MASGDIYLKLSDDYVTTIGTLQVSEDNSYNITLDLNGKKLDGAAGTAIKHGGSGMLTMTDSTTSDSSGTVSVNGNKAIAIENASTGTVAITGGKVNVSGDRAVAIKIHLRVP